MHMVDELPYKAWPPCHATGVGRGLPCLNRECHEWWMSAMPQNGAP